MSVGGAGKCLLIILPLLCVIFNIAFFQRSELVTDSELTGNELIQDKKIEISSVDDPTLSFNSNQQKQNEHIKEEQESRENHVINNTQNLVDPKSGKNDRKSERSIIKHVNDSEIFNAMANVTAASVRHMFWAGFCNQYMMFVGLIILAKKENYGQILVESFKWKDTFGTNLMVRHSILFDVAHWNTFYPMLPKLVNHDEQLLPDVEVIPNKRGVALSSNIVWNVDMYNATKPHYLGEIRNSGIHAFRQYNRQISRNEIKREQFEKELMKDAFRPHPAIQAIIDDFLGDSGDAYFVLHARVEPDMQKHGMCLDLKVPSLKEIISHVEEKFKDPPVSTMIIMLDRELLEKEVRNTKTPPNTLAVENLDVLNQITTHGMWNGRVKVVEAGSKLAIESKHEIYSRYPAIVGGIINFFIAANSQVFIGTQVSSYSMAIIKTRFYRKKMENYYYIPSGLELATSQNMTDAPMFFC
ncbi:hypothetical protein CTEN210_12738 [Chaetoceros tenuissimus]|uniref:O-fucosyltransferase family protein n=1 Tax=Chaetoceros tenuissimus TaxID=426638 RepID=A0AAD3D1R3_9STRA|nr:hypothetical protein CTEN210_12738 [Chaetoceros tenuissimus]